MTAPSWMHGPPTKILLATDLSHRCDRALDRATALAAQWQSALIILHVLEKFDPGTLEAEQLSSWRRPLDPVRVITRRLFADVGAAGRIVRSQQCPRSFRRCPLPRSALMPHLL
jgi:nucleotide-binding universal stress UspA family protein